MYSLIISCDGEDYVHVGTTRERVEKLALDMIKKEIMSKDGGTWETFGELDVEKLLLEVIESKDTDSAMELFTDISDARGEMCHMRIVKAYMEMDA